MKKILLISMLAIFACNEANAKVGNTVFSQEVNEMLQTAPTAKAVTGTWSGYYHGNYATYVFNANASGKVIIDRSGGTVTIPFTWKVKGNNLVLTVRNGSVNIKINGLSNAQLNQAIAQFKQQGTVTETYSISVESSSVLIVDGSRFNRK